MKHQSSENILKNLNREDSEVNRKGTMKSSTFKYKLYDLSDNEEEMEFPDKNEEKKNKMMELRRKLKIKNNELLKKRHFFIKQFNLYLKKKKKKKRLKYKCKRKKNFKSF